MRKLIEHNLCIKSVTKSIHDDIQYLIDRSCTTLYVRKHYKMMLPFCFLSYILIRSLLYLDTTTCTYPLPLVQQSWIHVLVMTVYGAMFWIHFFQWMFVSIYYRGSANSICENFTIIHALGTVVYVTSFVSMAYPFFFDDGTFCYCLDSSKIFWSKSDIADWIVNVPIINYIIVSFDEKVNLTEVDMKLILSTGIIVASRLMFFIPNFALSMFLHVVLSLTFWHVVYILILYLIVCSKLLQTNIDDSRTKTIIFRKQSTICWLFF